MANKNASGVAQNSNFIPEKLRVRNEKPKEAVSQRNSKDINSSSSPTVGNQHRRGRIQAALTHKERPKDVQSRLSNVKSPEKIICAYYMDSLRRHWINFDEQDEFCRLYRGHFCQLFHETSICKSIRPTELSILEKKKVSLPKRESHKGNVQS